MDLIKFASDLRREWDGVEAESLFAKLGEDELVQIISNHFDKREEMLRKVLAMACDGCAFRAATYARELEEHAERGELAAFYEHLMKQP